MKKYLGLIGAGYLGFSVSFFAGFNFMTWQYYAICVPVIFLFAADNQLNKEN